MTGPGHLAFGLGRWACPGRFFAVAGKMNPICLIYKLVANYIIEIKMMVWSVLSNMKVELVGDKYEIVDKLMIASAPPEASFTLTRRNA